jgi:WD40 repeat protein
LWEVETGEKLREFKKHANSVHGVAFSPDGILAASASSDHTVVLWDVLTGSWTRELAGHTDAVLAVAFSPDGSFLVSGAGGAWKDGKWVQGTETELRVWSMQTGKVKTRIRVPGQFVRSVAVSPDARHALSCGGDLRAYLWDLDKGKERDRLEGHSGGVVCVTFTADGGEALTACLDGTLRRWQLPPPGPPVTRPSVAKLVLRPQVFDKHTEAVRAVAVTSDGKYILSAGGGIFKNGKLVVGSDHDIRVWNPITFRQYRLPGHKGAVNCLAVIPDSQLAVSGSEDGTVQMWDLKTRKRVLHFRKSVWGMPLESVRAVAVSPNRRFVVSGGNKLVLWDVRTGAPLRQYPNPDGYIRAVAFAPDSLSFAACGSRASLDIWDLNGRKKRTFPDNSTIGWCLAFSRDGKSLLAGHGGKLKNGETDYKEPATICLWNVSTGDLRGKWPAHTTCAYSLAFSPDDRRIISGGADNLVMIWDALSGKLICRLAGHTRDLTRVAYLPDGKHAISSSDDSTVRIWQLPEAAWGPPERK